jgi:hypothetical protein
MKHQLQLLPYSNICSYEQLISNYGLYKLTAKSWLIAFNQTQASEYYRIFSCFKNAYSVVEDNWKRLRIFMPKVRQSKSFAKSIILFFSDDWHYSLMLSGKSGLTNVKRCRPSPPSVSWWNRGSTWGSTNP